MKPGFFSQASHSVLEEVVDASRRCGSGGGCGNRREADTNVRLLLQARHFDGPAAFRSGRVQLVADMMGVLLSEMCGGDRLPSIEPRTRSIVESEIKELPVRLLTADPNLLDILSYQKLANRVTGRTTTHYHLGVPALSSLRGG